MKKVLLISHAYPPAHNIASLRAGKVAKYLPTFGWEPIILTVERHEQNLGPKDELQCGKVIRTRDFYLFSEIERLTRLLKGKNSFPSHEPKINKANVLKRKPKDSLVKRIYFQILNNLFCFPDSRNGWYFMVRKNYRSLFSFDKINMIFSSSGPFTDHLIASFLKVRFRVPWVADFRDLWSKRYVDKRWSPLRIFETLLERKTVDNCDVITTVSYDFAQELHYLHNKPVQIIPNGFDPDDYRVFYSKKHKNKRFTLAYTGNVYEDKQDPKPLLQAIKNIIQLGKISRDDISLNFYGKKQAWLEDLVADLGISEVVTFHGVVPFSDSVRIQTQADILVLFFSRYKNERGWIPAKIFEYLGARKPILAIGPACGMASDILVQTGAGITMTNTEDIMNLLLEKVGLWKAVGFIEYNGDVDTIDTLYSRKSQTRQLASLFDKLYESSRFQNKK